MDSRSRRRSNSYRHTIAEDVMVRMRLLALLGLSLAVVAHAADPKPPWQRMLSGDDAKKAARLQ